MNSKHRRWAIVALATAGALWGLTVPLSKLGLEWLGASWLTVARFAVAAPVLALLARRHLRAALTPAVAAAGALGYGAVILLQNAGIERTSVGHAALVVGAVPVLVTVLAAAHRRSVPGAAAWAGPLVAPVLGLALAGTLAGFWLFAWAQVRVPTQLASAFVNLEPLVGAMSGVVAFHEAVGPAQALGGLALLAGIALSALLDSRSRARDPQLGYGSRPRQRSEVTNAAMSASRPAAANPALISRRSSRVPICEPSRS